MSRPRSIQLFMVVFAICCTSLLGGDEESGNDLIRAGDFEGETLLLDRRERTNFHLIANGVSTSFR